MNNTYRYKLEKGSKKYYCPSCNKKRYVRFIDTFNNNSILPYEFGYCDRIENCGYHLNPYKSGYAKENYIKDKELNDKLILQCRTKTKDNSKPEFIPFDIYKNQLNNYHFH